MVDNSVQNLNAAQEAAVREVLEETYYGRSETHGVYTL